MHMLCVKIAEYSVHRQWISSKDKPWCIYALEKKLLTAVYFLSLVPFGLYFHTLKQMAIYSSLLLLLRRRFGGWHAPSSRLCLLLSITQVLIISLIIGPQLLDLNWQLLLVFDAITFLVAMIVKPVYPEQVHFNKEIVKENHRRKNYLLLGIVILQILLGVKHKVLFVYCFLAALTSVISVGIELAKQRLQVVRKK